MVFWYEGDRTVTHVPLLIICDSYTLCKNDRSFDRYLRLEGRFRLYTHQTVLHPLNLLGTTLLRPSRCFVSYTSCCTPVLCRVKTKVVVNTEGSMRSFVGRVVPVTYITSNRCVKLRSKETSLTFKISYLYLITLKKKLLTWV